MLLRHVALDVLHVLPGCGLEHRTVRRRPSLPEHHVRHLRQHVLHCCLQHPQRNRVRACLVDVHVQRRDGRLLSGLPDPPHPGVVRDRQQLRLVVELRDPLRSGVQHAVRLPRQRPLHVGQLDVDVQREVRS